MRGAGEIPTSSCDSEKRYDTCCLKPLALAVGGHAPQNSGSERDRNRWAGGRASIYGVRVWQLQTSEI